MSDTSKPILFDPAEQYLFKVCHPVIADTDQSLEVFNCEATYPKAIMVSIAMIAEFDLPWVELSHGDWSRRISRDALWLTGSGKLISAHHSIFLSGKSPQKLLADEPLLKKTSFGWGLYNSDFGLDGMAHKYIGWHLNPMIHKYFDRCVSFAFYLSTIEPELPDWLDAEYFPSEKAIAVYGVGKVGKGVIEDADDIAHEISIAIQIQSVFGIDEANKWVKFHRRIQTREVVR